MKNNTLHFYYAFLFVCITLISGCRKEPEIVLPTLTTLAVSDITTNSAKSGGNITSDGGDAITSRGVIWGITTNLTTDNCIGLTMSIPGTGMFNSDITDLSRFTTYYVRSFATNKIGIAYGNEIEFKTNGELPVVVTEEVLITGITTAKGGGSITDDGGDEILSRGTVWSTSPNPTIENNNGITEDGNGMGVFSSELIGLESNTSYFIRAYASNSLGLGYGNEIYFKTPGAIDVEGNLYTTVLIGNQEWFAENLRTTKYNDGSQIPLVINNYTWIGQNSHAYCWFNNDISNMNTQGALYNWYAVVDGRLCPTGWHVPTNEEWYILENFIDPTINDPYVVGWLGYDGGTKLKANQGWVNNGSGTDDFGFCALPAGRRRYDDGIFDRLGIMGYWWSRSEHSYSYAWYRCLHNEYTTIGRQGAYKQFGFSVRCVKD